LLRAFGVSATNSSSVSAELARVVLLTVAAASALIQSSSMMVRLRELMLPSRCRPVAIKTAISNSTAPKARPRRAPILRLEKFMHRLLVADEERPV
jgi:hypothetical protein